MIYKTSLTKKGQITIPQEVREELGFYGPAKVIFDFDKKTQTFKIKTVPELLSLGGIVNKISKVKPKDPVKLRKWMETHYERS